MKTASVLGSLLLCVSGASGSAQSNEDDVPPLITSSSPTFTSSAESVEKFLSQEGFDDGMEVQGLGSATSTDIQKLRAEINAATPIGSVANGGPERYDVILQPGHYGRTKGSTGTGGKLISEQRLSAFVVSRAAEILRKSGKKVLIVSADNFRRDDPATSVYDGLSTRVFVSFHADGSVKPCATGPSLAYSSNSSTYAMHALGWGLARALGYRYSEFRKDNFTGNSAHYYMFREVRASDMAGLLEMGELTCPSTEQALIANAKAIAANSAHAINFVLDVPFRPIS
jgi:N-acetylmuramoyl-L-alanine amidase